MRDEVFRRFLVFFFWALVTVGSFVAVLGYYGRPK